MSKNNPDPEKFTLSQLPCKVLLISGNLYPAQGYFCVQPGKPGSRASETLITGRPALHPEPQLLLNMQTLKHNQVCKHQVDRYSLAMVVV